MKEKSKKIILSIVGFSFGILPSIIILINRRNEIHFSLINTMLIIGLISIIFSLEILIIFIINYYKKG